MPPSPTTSSNFSGGLPHTDDQIAQYPCPAKAILINQPETSHSPFSPQRSSSLKRTCSHSYHPAGMDGVVRRATALPRNFSEWFVGCLVAKQTDDGPSRSYKLTDPRFLIAIDTAVGCPSSTRWRDWLEGYAGTKPKLWSYRSGIAAQPSPAQRHDTRRGSLGWYLRWSASHPHPARRIGQILSHGATSHDQRHSVVKSQAWRLRCAGPPRACLPRANHAYIVPGPELKPARRH